MTGKNGSNDNNPPDLKTEGRAAADELQQKHRDQGDSDFAWFDDLYKQADGERGFIPWSEAAPRFKLVEWLRLRALKSSGPDGGKAIDVGCGLGDNAQCLAEAHYDVTAFDISQTAVAWARENATSDNISFEAANIFDLPEKWLGAFDLVHETYTLQSMPPEAAARAVPAIASLVAPGGTLLVMTRARDVNEEIEGPPRPLDREQLSAFEDCGLTLIHFEEFHNESDPPIRHFLAEYIRESSG